MGNILSIKMQDGNDAKAKTVGDYLVKLLTKLWSEGEGFSGKRPFGNSGWKYELYTALGTSGAIDATLDSDGDMADFDRKAADLMIFEAIKEMHNG